MFIALTAPDFIFPFPAAQRTDSGKGTGSCAAGKGKRVLCVDRFYTPAALTELGRADRARRLGAGHRMRTVPVDAFYAKPSGFR